MKLPESWEECSPKLYSRVCWLLVSGLFDTPRMRKWLVKYTKLPKRAVAMMSESEVNIVLQCLKWTMEPPIHATGKVGWWWLWKGPTSGFQNVNGLQYGHADQRFQNYQKAAKDGDSKKSIRLLTEFASIMMTPFGLEYSPRVARLQLWVMKLMPLRIKMALVYEFWGMTNFLSKHFPKAFSRRKKGPGRDYGWPGMFEVMAGPKFGPMSQVKREKVYDLFLHIEQDLAREEALKRKGKRT